MDVGGRPPVIIPVYMVAADLDKSPRPDYYVAADLARYQAEVRAGAAASNKSPDTQDYYSKQLKRLTEILGRDVEWMLSHGAMATSALVGAKRIDGRSMLEEWGTLRGLVMAALTVYKYVPEALARWPEGHRAWSAVLSEQIKPEAKRKDDSSELTERQKDGWVEWSEVQSKTRELLKESPPSVEALLLAIYTMRKGVARADYGDLRVYRPPSDAVPAADSEEMRAYPNYIEWQGSWGSGAGEMVLRLAAFKTAKSMKTMTETLSAELAAVIAASMRAKPRPWLFVKPSDSKPYDAAAFSKMACRALKRVFGKPLTLQVLRHSGVTALELGKLTEGERGEISKAYNHGPERQLIYRVVHKEKREVGAEAKAAAARMQEESAKRKKEKRARERTKLVEQASARAKARANAKAAAAKVPPNVEAPKVEGPKVEGPKVEGPKVEGPRVVVIKAVPPKVVGAAASVPKMVAAKAKKAKA